MIRLIDLLIENKNKKFLSKTRTGEIYSINDRIIKITNDYMEYENALILIEFPSKYFARYYSAKQIDDENFELELERLYDCTDNEYSIIALILNSLGSMEYMLDKNRYNKFIQELKTHPEYYEDYGTLNDVLKILKNMYNIYEDANQRDIKLYDLILDNIMKNKRGTIVHFDVGS